MGDLSSLYQSYVVTPLFLPLLLKDLFDNRSDRIAEDNNSEQDRSRAETMSNDFHFSLDEDTQFTQILNTQGYVCHNKTLCGIADSIFFFIAIPREKIVSVKVVEK